ncbi:tRNA dihydrouridine synthase DusB [Roseospirillum parvum]|nr:tRNA dihydrouridine synthase DusB [Roseospirillum parvum]
MPDSAALPPALGVGPLTLDPPVLLAPMSGITDRPFRALAREYGAGITVSEMIAGAELMHAHRRHNWLRAAPLDEAPLIVQLAGRDPALMAEAARFAADQGAAMIDLNMGCPAKKVVNGASGGAALMRDETLAGDIMARVVAAVTVPVSMKMRLGWDRDSLNAPRLAAIAEEEGISLLTVHGRTRDQFYGGTVDPEGIAAVKAATRLPLIANGDVTDPASARRLLAATGADGVMVGRACQGAPWLPGRLAEALRRGTPLRPPAAAEETALVVRHFDALLGHYGTENGLKVARKHIGWYTRGKPGGAVFRAAYFAIEDAARARAAIADFLARAAEAGMAA